MGFLAFFAINPQRLLTKTLRLKARVKNNHNNHSNPSLPFWLKSWPLVAWLEPMAVISSSAQTASSFGGWAPTPCRRGFAFFAVPNLRRRCCFFGRSPEEVAAELKVGRDHPVLGRDVAATASLDELVVRVARLERVVEQIAGAPVPQVCSTSHRSACRIQLWSWLVMCQSPRFGSHSLKGLILYHGSACRIVRRSRLWIPLCLRSWRRICSLLHRSASRIVRRSRLWVSSVPQIMEADLLSSPQEREQNRVREQIVGFLCLGSLRSACRIVRRLRLRIPQCLISRGKMWKSCFLHLWRACRIASGSSLRIPLCHGTWRAVVEVGRVTPQERVQNRPRKLFVDLPVPLITENYGRCVWFATGACAKSRHVHWKSVYRASSSSHG